jgi:hypothetical protein
MVAGRYGVFQGTQGRTDFVMVQGMYLRDKTTQKEVSMNLSRIFCLGFMALTACSSLPVPADASALLCVVLAWSGHA